MVNKRILRLAISKCRRFSDTKQWCGYLTDAEIMALLQSGATPAHKGDWIINRTNNNIKNGISSPIWFYFYPNGIKMKDSL